MISVSGGWKRKGAEEKHMAQWYFNTYRPQDKRIDRLQGEFFSQEAISDPGRALVREGRTVSTPLLNMKLCLCAYSYLEKRTPDRVGT